MHRRKKEIRRQDEKRIKDEDRWKEEILTKDCRYLWIQMEMEGDKNKREQNRRGQKRWGERLKEKKGTKDGKTSNK
jgi:hypothetical protein